MDFGRDDYNKIFKVKAEHTPSPAKYMDSKEPVFLLRGCDPFAPHYIRCWANDIRAVGGDEGIVLSALAQADKMEAWPGDGQDKKLPDLPK